MSDSLVIGCCADGFGTAILPGIADRVEVRDTELTDASGPAVVNVTTRLSQALVTDLQTSETASGMVRAETDSLIGDSAFINFYHTAVACGTTCNVIQEQDGAVTGVTYQNVTVGWEPGFGDTEAARAIHVRATAEETLTYDGVLVYNFNSAEASPFALGLTSVIAGNLIVPAGPCLDLNEADYQATSNVPATVRRGEPLGLVHPDGYRWDPHPGSVADVAGCGIRWQVPPGAVYPRRFHRQSRQRPWVMGSQGPWRIWGAQAR